MASQGPLSPATVVNIAGADYDWLSPEEAGSHNDIYANVQLNVPFGVSDLLRATNFGFDLPVGATAVDGVLMEMEVEGEQSIVADHECYLVKAGVRAGDNRGPGVGDLWLSPFSYHSRGGVSDLWGTTVSVADVEDSGFGVEIAVTNYDEISDKSCWVDHIRMTVYYSEVVPSGVTTPDFSRFPRHRLRRNG